MRFIVTTIILVLFSTVNSYKLKLLKFEKCDPDVNYTIDIDAKITEENGQQYIEDGFMKTPLPLSDDTKLVIDVYILENEDYKHIITIKKDYCQALYKYAPEMVYEWEDLVGIERDACPIPAGEYRIDKYPLDFSKIKRDEEFIEEGQIRAVVNYINGVDESNLACLVVEVLKTKDE